MKTKIRIRNYILFSSAALAALALGCLISGDDPVKFIVRLFTLEYVPELSAGAGIVTVALFGFLTSFHCIGMCGGVILSQCAGREHGGAGEGLKYNLGRMTSCTLVGFLAGALGRVVSLNGHLKALVPLICAIVMLVMGLQLLGLFRWLSGAYGISEPWLMKKLKGRGTFIIGFVTGFMPCGMLQIAQLHALGSGSPVYGAASMLIFALASSPVLFIFGTLAGSLTAKKRVLAVKAAAVLVLILGIRLMLKALNMMGG